MPDPAPPWKDPKWKDPDKVLPEVVYDGVPISEVAHDLRKKFDEAFDVVIPTSWAAPNNPGVVNTPSSTEVRMQLKNVNASEVFNAMNLVFETDNAPLRWELRMNGSRPTVVLRVLSGFLPPYASPPPEQPRRKIYFVGELLGDGMTMEQLVKTISEVYEMSYGTAQGPISSHLQFHKEAQLLIATGTVDEINFVAETLAALRQKLDHKPKAGTGGGGGGGGPKAELKPTTEKTKTP
jgi:hypothetical protein